MQLSQISGTGDRAAKSRGASRAGALLLVAAVLVVALTSTAAAVGPATITLLPPTPAPGTTIGVTNPLLKVEFDDPEYALNRDTLKMKVDGRTVRPVFAFFITGYWYDDYEFGWLPLYDWTRGTATFQTQNLAAGPHTVSVSIKNYAGQMSSVTWLLGGAAPPPKLVVRAPAAGSTVTTQAPAISVSVDTANPVSSFEMQVDSIVVDAAYDPVSMIVSYTPSVRLANGVNHTVRVSVVTSDSQAAAVSWSFHVQIFPAMVSTGYAPCSDCHAGFPVPNHPMEACDSCHGPGGPVGMILHPSEYAVGQPSHEPDYIAGTDCEYCHGSTYQVVPMHRGEPGLYHASTQTACAGDGCHETVLTIEHNRSDGGRTPLDCLVCHQSTAPAVMAAIAAGNTDCSACHGFDTSSSHAAAHGPDAALTAAYVDCSSAGCHDLNLVDEHVAARGLSCGACHDSTDPSVQDAIAAGAGVGPQQGCYVCHGADAGRHAAQHALTNPTVPECTLCHADNLVTEHLVDHPGTCGACHESANATVQAVIAQYGSGGPSAALNPVCTDCHNTGTYHTAAAAAHTYAESAECQGCHLMILPDEHARPTSAISGAGCAGCHPLPSGFTATDRCVDCHVGGGLAPVEHQAVAAVHQSSQTSCATAGCHEADLTVVHVVPGCGTCHSTTKYPATTDCQVCHGTDAHADLTAAHTAVETGVVTYDRWGPGGPSAPCDQCHYLSVIDEHAKSSSSTAAAGCSACHPTALASITRPWNQRCSACHASIHPDYEAAHVVEPSATNDCWTCHTSIMDARNHLTCANLGACHVSAAAVPATKDCHTCHPNE
ncbi:MAG: hypothetical protein ACYC33_00085 [Thermoleophilia bacterium]